jgi:adenine deaminase
VPGFIDAHMHLESSKLLVDEFARLVLPLGTTTVVVDPHEIANVLGIDGVHWLLDVCGELPLDVYFMASSSVPASRFESPRRPLSPGDLEGLLRRRRVIGLAEMMNFPGVVEGDPHELAKLALPGAQHVDGHAPGVMGKALNAYAPLASAPTTRRSRSRRGASGSGRACGSGSARPPRQRTPRAAPAGQGVRAGAHRLLHRRPRARAHIAEDGHINSMVRDAVAAGIPAEDALVMSTLNPATWHGLAHLARSRPATRPTCSC